MNENRYVLHKSHDTNCANVIDLENEMPTIMFSNIEQAEKFYKWLQNNMLIKK